MTEGKGFLKSLGAWVKGEIVQDVPEDSALCEFDCQRDQCTHEEWDNYDRRKRAARGEIMPMGVDIEMPEREKNPSTEKRGLLAS